MEEVAVAVQYRIPFVLVMLNNAYLGLIRQTERGPFKFDENFEVAIGYGPDGYGVNHVKVMEGMGAPGIRVSDPGKIREALAWARETSNAQRLPVLVEILIEQEENAAMGSSIADIKEFDEILDVAPEPAREPVHA
jgi:tartronate-semialdehyde synthase